MEPIIPILTSLQDSKTIEAPENAASGEGDFHSVLTALQSSGEEREDKGDQDFGLADPLIMSIFSSLLQAPLDSIPSPEIPEGQLQNEGPTTQGQIDFVNSVTETIIPLPEIPEGQLRNRSQAIQGQVGSVKPVTETIIPLPVDSVNSVTETIIPLPEIPEGQLQDGVSAMQGQTDSVNPLTETNFPDVGRVVEKDLSFSGKIMTREETALDSASVSLDQGKGLSALPGTPLTSRSSPLDAPPLAQDSSLPSPSSGFSSDQAVKVPAPGTPVQEDLEPKVPPAVNPTIHYEKDQPRSGNPADSSKVVLTDQPVGGGEISPLARNAQNAEENLKTMIEGDRPGTDSRTKNWKGADETTTKEGPKNSVVSANEDKILQSLRTDATGPKPLWNRFSVERPVTDALAEESGDFSLSGESRPSEPTSAPLSDKQYDAAMGSSLVSKSEGTRATVPSPHEVTGAGQSVLSKPESAEMLQQISRKLIWSLRNGEEKIRLQLEPPHLGSLYIEIDRQKDAIQATLWTSTQGTKEILESHRVELQKILKEDGFELGKFDVFVDQNMRFAQERRESDIAQDRWGHASREPHGSPVHDEPEVAPGMNYSAVRGNQRIDLFI